MNFFVSLALLNTLLLVVAALERIPALRFRPHPILRPYLATDVAWYLVAASASAISVLVLRPQLSKLAFEPVGRWVGELPVAARLVLALVLFDLISYAVHVGLHRSDALWNVHKVHHSSLRLDGLATTRAHMFENGLRFVVPQTVLFLIGMPAAQVAPAVAVYAAFGLLNHSNLGINLGWAESVFVTPRLHRRHHVPATSHNNFGTVFSVWDRAFGKLVRLDTEAHERFGVSDEIDFYPQRFGPALRQPVTQIRQLRQDKLAARMSSVGDESGVADEPRVMEEIGTR